MTPPTFWTSETHIPRERKMCIECEQPIVRDPEREGVKNWMHIATGRTFCDPKHLPNSPVAKPKPTPEDEPIHRSDMAIYVALQRESLVQHAVRLAGNQPSRKGMRDFIDDAYNHFIYRLREEYPRLGATYMVENYGEKD